MRINSARAIAVPGYEALWSHLMYAAFSLGAPVSRPVSLSPVVSLETVLSMDN